MSNEKMREEFEVWWTESMNTIEMDLHRFGNGYSCHETNRCWMAWQASRAALCVKIPKRDEYSEIPYGTIEIFEVQQALDNAGVKYK